MSTNVRQEATENNTILLSQDEYKARRALEIASKRGLVEMDSGDSGNKAKFKVNVPWIDSRRRGGASSRKM